MRKFCFHSVFTLLLIAVLSSVCFAQGSGSSLSGTVVDQTGAVIPGAEVVVRNDNTGTEYKAITADNGTFSIPSLSVGTYTATVSMPNFKQSITKNIVLVTGTPTTVNIKLEVGGRTETVTVTAGAEVIQTASATVSNTLTNSQIVNLPLQTRNALDFMVFMPNANTTGSARNTTFMGLASTFINISVDGINTQDNYNKNSDGFYTMITVRPDSIQEVTVNTAASGADSSGGGAVSIKFVTRGGNNDYHGSLYDYERNYALNSNYWFNNRDMAPVYWGDVGKGQTCTAQQLVNEFEKCKAPRSKVIVHQAGGRFGGPIWFPKLFNGKDKAFFFINMERFMMPSSVTRTNTIYAPGTENGIYSYVYRQSGQPDVVKTVDLWALAQANGQVATIDPTGQKLISDVRAAVQKKGTINTYPMVVTDPLYQQHIWMIKGTEIRNYITTRLDFNVSSKHRVEASFNGENRLRDPDNVNGVAPRYPDMPNYGVNQGIRGAVSAALRSTITPRIVNEARAGFTMGTTLWYHNVPGNTACGDANGVANMGCYFWTPNGMSSLYITSSTERRNAPNKTFEDTMTWSKGSHSFSFGGRFEHRAGWRYTKSHAPGLTMSLSSQYDPAYIMFDSNNGPKNFPNATSGQISTAASLYAGLTARITAIGGTAYRDENTGDYVQLGGANRRSRQRFMGLYLQDTWRIRPNFTFNYGARWEVNFPWMPLNKSYSWSMPAETWGLSGVNSLFKPGASGGIASVVYQYNPGDPAYNVDYKAVNPTVGFAWSPQAGGVLGKFLGSGAKTVVRGGFSISYLNYDVGTYDSMFFSNPGGNVATARNENLGNLRTNGTDPVLTYPILFRNRTTIPTMLNPAPFPKGPTYPLLVGFANSINSFEPDIRTPYTMTWSFGIQREITRDMAIEVRYSAQRTKQNWFQTDLNEANIVENQWIQEFRKAQGNLVANMAAGKGRTFRYDSTVTGTVPLPTIIKYLSPNNLDPNVAANYTSAVLGSTQAAVFTNSSYVNYLNTYAPSPYSLASGMYGDATRRTNAITSGLPANFFIVNPAVQGGGAWIYKNGGGSLYDSMVVELRRRLSKGLLIQASYTLAKGSSYTQLSWRVPMAKDLQNQLPHAFKLNWVYELPFGQGKEIFNGAGRLTDRLIGGWELEGTSRIQSGSRLDLGNVNLVGMTDQEFRDSLGIYFDDINKKIWYVPTAIKDQTYLAYQYDAGGFTGGQAPSGRYWAAAGSGGGGNCIQVVSGDCSPRHHYARGLRFVRVDLSLVKRIRFTESANFELRGEFLNAFNNINFSTPNLSGSSLNNGLISSAFTDASNSQDPGGRLIQIVLRINF
jgi:hypothetical protein